MGSFLRRQQGEKKEGRKGRLGQVSLCGASPSAMSAREAELYLDKTCMGTALKNQTSGFPVPVLGVCVSLRWVTAEKGIRIRSILGLLLGQRQRVFLRTGWRALHPKTGQDDCKSFNLLSQRLESPLADVVAVWGYGRERSAKVTHGGQPEACLWVDGTCYIHLVATKRQQAEYVRLKFRPRHTNKF